MCGIFGVSSSTALNQTQQRFITQCTFVGTLRGVDSTGLCLVDKENNVEVFKKALSGPDFFTSRLGQSCLEELENSFLVIGHNRAATRGKVNDLTAHPFQYGNITAVHNGTLSWQSSLPVTKHTVDSENLIESMSQIEDITADSLAEFMSKVEGSYAINAYDQSTEMLWLVRNDERPLSYLTDTNGDLYWASEAGMLLWVAERVGIKFKPENVVHMPATKVMGFNATTMEFVDEKEYVEPDTGVWGGNYGNYGNGSKYGSSYSSRKQDATYDSEAGTKVKYVGTSDAIRQKKWSEEDKNLAVVYTNLEKGAEHKGSKEYMRHTGVAFSSDGEVFKVLTFASPEKIDLNAVYEGEVQTILYDAKDETIIHRVTVSPGSLQRIHKAGTKAAKQMIKDMQEEAILIHGDLSGLNGITFPKNALVTIEKEDTKAKEEKSNVENIEKARNKSNYVRGPANCFISEEEFNEMAQGGCHHCKRAIPVAEAEDTGWLNNKYPVCQDCIEVVQECMGVDEVDANAL